MIPLTVEYRQRYHAVGKIPTSSANRTDNRRQTDSEILASRAIDRSLRPLLLLINNSNNNGEDKIHLTCSIQSYPVKEQQNNSNNKDPSTATIQGYQQQQQQQQSDVTNNDDNNNNNNIMGELLYAGTKDSVIMMEFSGMLSESQILELIQFAHECIQPVIKTQEANSKRMSIINKEQQNNQHSHHQSDIELRKQLGLDTIEVVVDSAATIPNNKQTKENNVKIHSEATDGMLLGKVLRGRREHLVKEEIKPMKDASIQYKSRADGRGSDSTTNGCDTIRPISMDVPLFSDIVHGSALFTRGETQVLCTTTLGPPKDGILLHHNDPYVSSANTTAEKANNDRRRAFLQYDFPAYCKGEVQTGPGNTSRREIGHGALAEKSILPVLPSASEFPYAIRMTSEVTSSNGSSSMASVCGVTLSLLDAGVPITAPVAGVSVGLVQDKHNNSHHLLLDITGTEDHFGVIDFKVAGTREKVTAFQLDVKEALSFSVIADALNLAKVGRNAIIEEMKAQCNTSSKGDISDLSPRPEPKATAPRCSVVRFDPARKKDLLGPGGVVIRQMEDRFNVSLDLTQEGQFGDDREMVRKAKAAVMDLVSDVEVGLTYEGTIIEIRDFGIIIELLRNKEGLCHVSELAKKEKIKKHPEGTLGLVNDLFKVGQTIDVVCTAVDPVQGTIRLRPASKKESS
ncbi:hypothetical protein FRACYDRAFT_194953 [Fragilariopsis cylindrus CCMP1102]|uniref:polyribonucleotide nucleotidyltransferase n=1 Tax=Fragilariopsis cylindrus CCMP1102 TaxID=635003 RepID=A0A1E7EUN3_9STRA|nr:hypothetical protein FRACYDRAFT_194953 [Fragilariopsis cylindrus CCMP1102]|eukprot:OEU09504.1 hypothetical protein FRACYDRAFT_194953 [Fragilariopsis cylindrus CCMP1102]